ncbi:hypothetical protein ACIBEA_36125 [Streptomyces sp. NPDC051555]|uniref:hypothetical protein n=1 Tax=Streptomyces sp. NPDC051555 TaxID=3365657 RepID=UPI0037996E19
MPDSIRIGDFVRGPVATGLHATGYAKIGEFELSDFLTRWDEVQTGSMITLGPGIAVGRRSVIASSVCMGSAVVPPASVVRSSSPEVVIEPRRMPPPPSASDFRWMSGRGFAGEDPLHEE